MQPNDPNSNQTQQEAPAPQMVPSTLAQNSRDVPTLPPSLTAPSVKPQRKIPIVPIAVAVFVSLMLIGAVVFIYATSQKNGTKDQTQTDNSQTQVDEGKVSANDVDAVSKKIEDSLNSLNDTADFRTEDLTNQTLGL